MVYTILIFIFLYLISSWIHFSTENNKLRALLNREIEKQLEDAKVLSNMIDNIKKIEQVKPVECIPIASELSTETLFSSLDKSLSVGNPTTRDVWIAEKARGLFKNSEQSVFDVSAGAKPYKSMFVSVGWKYFSNEFSDNNNIVDDFRGENAQDKINMKKNHDYIGTDIGNTGAPSNKFDLVILTEVLEHLPEPAQAIPELKRVTKPGGDILITSPFTSGSHQLPYHFSSGYPREWYKHFADKHDLDVIEMTSQGDVFKLLAQETSRGFTCGREVPVNDGQAMSKIKDIIYWYFLMKSKLNDDNSASCYSQFTIGWMVHLRKRVL